MDIEDRNAEMVPAAFCLPPYRGKPIALPAMQNLADTIDLNGMAMFLIVPSAAAIANDVNVAERSAGVGVLWNVLVAMDTDNIWTCDVRWNDLAVNIPSSRHIQRQEWWRGTVAAMKGKLVDDISPFRATHCDFCFSPEASTLRWLLGTSNAPVPVPSGDVTLHKVSDPVKKRQVWMRFTQIMYQAIYANQRIVVSARQRARAAEEVRANSVASHQRFAKDNQQDKSEIMLKCIDLINAKKHKIRDLMAERDRLKDVIGKLKRDFTELNGRVKELQADPDAGDSLPSVAPAPRRRAPPKEKPPPKPRAPPKEKPTRTKAAPQIEVSEESEDAMESFLGRSSEMRVSSDGPVSNEIPASSLPEEAPVSTKRTRPQSTQESLDEPPPKRVRTARLSQPKPSSKPTEPKPSQSKPKPSAIDDLIDDL